MTNWAGNIAFPGRVHRPGSVEELRRLVAGSTRIRALGSGHSFSTLLEAPGEVVTVAGLPPFMELDGPSVTVAGGVRYGELAGYLDRAGYALPNLGSLPHISVAGACSTGTHGSGDRNGNLATAVSAVELVTADGDLATVRRGDPDFGGVALGLGGLGIITRLTLDVVPAFEMRQYVYDNLPVEQATGHLDEILASAYSVSLFTAWSQPRIDTVWLKRRVDEPGAGDPPPTRWGATLADGPRHPIAGLPPEQCTEQLGVPGPWHARLPHFRLEFTPSTGDELQSEFLVPRPAGVAALRALAGIRERLAPVLQVCEIRSVAADELWMSPSYRRDSVALHFTWVKDDAALAPVLPVLEEVLAPLDARPHWAKLFTADDVRALYPRWADFVALLARYDPAGKFRNDFLDRYFPA
jgi:alditol oxidase